MDSALSLEELQQTKTGLYVAIFGSDTDFIETSTCPNTEHGRCSGVKILSLKSVCVWGGGGGVLVVGTR